MFGLNLTETRFSHRLQLMIYDPVAYAGRRLRDAKERIDVVDGSVHVRKGPWETYKDFERSYPSKFRPNQRSIFENAKDGIILSINLGD